MLVDSEHRLAETLLTLARKLGKANPGCTRIPQKITHEELSQMVGTTRPRITEFLRKFRGLGLVERSSDHCLVVREAELAAYLNRSR
jgi:CRP-like cAMP-binding protein